MVNGIVVDVNGHGLTYDETLEVKVGEPDVGQIRADFKSTYNSQLITILKPTVSFDPLFGNPDEVEHFVLDSFRNQLGFLSRTVGMKFWSMPSTS